MSFIIETDFNEVPAWDGTGGGGLPAGDYLFEVTDAEQVLSRSNEPVLKISVKVVETLQVGEGVADQTGNTMVKSYSLKPDKGPLGRLKNLFLALGTPLQGVSRDHIVGCVFKGTVQVRMLPGMMQPNGTLSEPRPFADIVGEQRVETVEEAQPEPAPAAGTGRKVVGASQKPAAANGAAARR